MKKHSKKQLVKKIIEAGFASTKEDKFGNILVKSPHGIDAYMQKIEPDTWKPVVNIQWINVYVLVPALAVSLGLAAMEIKGLIAMVGCAFFGLGVGTYFLRPKQQQVLEALEKL